MRWYIPGCIMASTMLLSIPLSWWLHRESGWPVSAVQPLAGFAILSLAPMVLWLLPGSVRPPRSAAAALILSTAALWSCLLAEARFRVSYPPPLSIGASFVLGASWIYYAFSLRRVRSAVEPATGAQ